MDGEFFTTSNEALKLLQLLKTLEGERQEVTEKIKQVRKEFEAVFEAWQSGQEELIKSQSYIQLEAIF